MPTHQLTQKGEPKPQNQDICLFAQTDFRSQMRRFGIKVDDRRRHMYVIGKTGMGKTTMMENMVLNDIYKGHGVGIVDPHGDFAEKIIDYIPAHRINDVVYFNPADTPHPIGFNILEVKTEEQKHLIAAGLMGTFKKIWPDVWSSRMEYILNNTLLALLDYPGSTLLGINRLLGEKSFRKKVVRALKDPVVKSFWQNEFENYEPRYQKEAVAPIQNKIGQFLSASVIRNMVAQVKSTINVREIMDTKKIFIMNLSKGRIGEDNSRLLGGMLITKIQLAAMERVDTPEEERKDFFLYVDEFQNFATPSFANILSEARKYRLSLIMAHQYVAQLDEIVADAVFGNVGTIVSFRVGGGDAEMLAKEFAPVFTEENIVNLSKFSILLKLMIDGVASQPFSAHTMPPIGSATASAEKVIRVSRERYGRNRDVIENKILRWSGMEAIHDDDEDDDDDMDVDTTKEKKNDRSANNKDAAKETDKKNEQEDTARNNDRKDREPKKESGQNSQEQPRQEQPKQQRQQEQPRVPSKRTDDTQEAKTVSFATLLSKEDREELEKAASPKTLPEQDASSSANTQASPKIDETPRDVLNIHFDKEKGITHKTDIKPEKKESVERPTSAPQGGQATSAQQDAQEGPKKRKRKRKRKKKSNSAGLQEAGNGSESRAAQQPSNGGDQPRVRQELSNDARQSRTTQQPPSDNSQMAGRSNNGDGGTDKGKTKPLEENKIITFD